MNVLKKKNRWMNKWVDQWKTKWTVGWIDWKKNRWVKKLMNGKPGEWMVWKWMSGWMESYKSRNTLPYYFLFLHFSRPGYLSQIPNFSRLQPVQPEPRSPDLPGVTSSLRLPCCSVLQSWNFTLLSQRPHFLGHSFIRCCLAFHSHLKKRFWTIRKLINWNPFRKMKHTFFFRKR